jgi:rhamnosyltransferase
VSAALNEYEHIDRITILRSATNFGVAAALNFGVCEARARDFQWVLTMDQDSIPHPDMTQAFCDYIARHPNAGCLTPTIATIGHRGVTNGPVEYAITSGNMVRIDVFDRVGPYWDALFIDGVDFDFSLRVRAAGIEIHLVRDAKMEHRLGATNEVGGWLGRFHTNHSPARRYYIMRNCLYLVERHWRAFPWFASRFVASQVISLFAVAWYGPARIESMQRMAQGVAHYARRRSGPLLARP